MLWPNSPGNVFAFKTIEYLGGGAHVISTPMGSLEKELEAGITYMPDNGPETISKTLREVATTGRWEQCASRFVHDTYGPAAVCESLGTLIRRVVNKRTANLGPLSTSGRPVQ